jgi:hypothetical protein
MTLALLLATGLGPRIATAQQATPTASRPMDLSLFGAVSGVNTGLSGGRNASLTIGGDLGFAPFLGLQPALEVRATLPLDKGVIDSQKDLLGGLRVNFLLAHRIHPYGDFLYGRGQVNYPGAGYLYNDFYYFQSVGNVLSPGAGFDYDLGSHLALKVDAQFQRWGSAPTSSGTINTTVGTVGVVYRFGSRTLP